MTTWISKVDGVDNVMAAHINLLQIEKLDRDGEVAATGTIQWKKGANIDSAATLVPGSDGNYFDVTGTATITAIAATQSQPGTVIKLHFTGACQITHHATDLIMPGGVNYTTSAGDELEFVEYAAGDWRCTNISPVPSAADGSNALSKITARSATWDKGSKGSSVAALAVGYASGASDLASAASQAASVAAAKASDASSAVAARSATWDKASDASAKAVAGSSNAASVAATILAKSSAWEVGGNGGNGGKTFCMGLFEAGVSVVVVDGAVAFGIPAAMNGMNLVNVTASVHTKGVTGTTDIQIRRRRAGADVDMLSTKITIGDEFFASDEVINAANDDVQTGDQIYIDVDAIHTTPPQGLSVTLDFELP